MVSVDVVAEEARQAGRGSDGQFEGIKYKLRHIPIRVTFNVRINVSLANGMLTFRSGHSSRGLLILLTPISGGD